MLPKMRYRLGLDIGAKSIGWAMIRLNAKDEPIALIKMGVRIFPDGRNPKDGSSLAVSRRDARAMRRRRDRLLMRKRALTKALIETGFFPEDVLQRKSLVTLDPYVLRKKALDEQLTPAEFARALFHINQRRGFKSNRKTDKKDNDSGALKTAISRVRELLKTQGVRTVGEWLANRHDNHESVRARLRGKTVKDRAYDFYIDRSMIEAEFDAIWSAQQKYSSDQFNETARRRLKDVLLFQRPLKPVEPGRCSLLPDEKRAAQALPSVQQFRIYQEVNNLAILDVSLKETSLTLEQRDAIVQQLGRKKELTFTGICKLLGFPGSTRFNLQDGKRDRLKGNDTSSRLAKDDLFGDQWHEFDVQRQNQIVTKLITEESEVTLIQWLQDNCGCDSQQAKKIADMSLPEGYGSLSEAALARINPELKKDVISFAEATERAGFDSHSALSHAEQTGELMAALPYYGEALQRHVGFGSGKLTDTPEKRFGKIANPTVHIGLNELRKVVNALIDRYGHPAEIVVEVARDLKQGKALREEINKQQAVRQEENRRYRDDVRSLIGDVEPSATDVQLMRLWVELNPDDAANRRCPYTGTQISMGMLFSDAVEIEHILPFSRTLDDSMNNKTVALRRANRDKGKQTPFEAFGHSPTGYDYQSILERAKLMPKEKARRFAPDAYERWLREEKDFLARALNDTAYLSRVAKEYLTLICDPRKVRVIPGRLTALLRGKYGLNALLSGSYEKNRNDHRHHAIDAVVIGITDRGLLQKFANANQYAREQGLRKLVSEMPLPWGSFREQVIRGLQHLIVSFKPDHGYQGGLHNETAYGLRADGQVAWRVPLSKFKNSKEVADTEFANPHFKQWLLKQVDELEGKPFMERIELIAREQGIRRARIVDTLKVIPIIGRAGTGDRHGLDEAGQPRAYKGYKGDSNYCMEIWSNDKGKWEGEVISTFEANQIARAKGWQALRDPKMARNGKPLVMRLMKGDYLRLSNGSEWKLCVIAYFSVTGTIATFEQNEANVDARARAKSYSYIFKTAGSLQKANAKHVTVSEIGEPKLHGHRH